MQKLWASIYRNTRGVAAVEFALALPLIMLLMLGSFEMSRYIILHQKLEKSAFTIADIVSQSEAVTIQQMNQTMLAAHEIMNPHDFPSDGLVIISSVHQADGQSPIIRWQHTGGGDLSATSEIGVVGEGAILPNGLVLNDKDNVIITEIFYSYEPFFDGFSVFTTPLIYKVVVFKPRLGALTTPPV